MLWRILGGLGLLGLAVLALWRTSASIYDNGVYAERVRWQAVAAKQVERYHALEVRFLDQRSAAQTRYVETIIRQQPIIQRSMEKVTVYAQTADGQRRCLGDDRVLGIAADRAALFADDTLSAGGSPGAVSPDAAGNGR